MIRFLAKMWNRRYIVLPLVVILMVSIFTLPGKLSQNTGNEQNNADNTGEISIEQEDNIENAPMTMYVNDTVTLYSKPNLKSKEVSTITEGTAVEDVKPAKDGWYSIEYNEDTVYVQGEYLVDEYIVETEPPVPPTEPPFEPYWSEDGKWLIVDEDVRTEGKVWLREKPDGKQLELVGSNEEMHRTEIGENGWSKVTSRSGNEGYVATFYLTPVKNVHYDEVEEFVIVTEDARVRASGSINSEQKGWVIKGDKYVRVGISQHGWSQILYKGQVRYVFSNYIEKIEKEVTESDLGNYVHPSEKEANNQP